MRSARPAIGALALVLLGFVGPAVASAAFPKDPPNDPTYAVDARCSRGSGQYWLLSAIPPQCALAHDPDGAAGMSVDAAWKRFTTGSPSTLISYTEGGVNWRRPEAKDFVNRTFLNTRELPRPQRADGTTCAAYDCNGDGRVNVVDYAADPRIKKPYLNGYLTPEDLVVAFGHCRIAGGQLGACPAGGHFDNDRNGFPNDISGWDFQHNSNDVQTDWSGYFHSNASVLNLVGEPDNGLNGVGVCPDCTVVFIKGGDEGVTLPQRQSLATIYAATIGVDVVTRESIGLGQSSYQRRTFQAALRRGLTMTDVSSDFESNSHTEGMLLDDTLPGNGLIEEANPASLVTGFRLRSSITSWGPHAMFSTPTDAGTSSETTPIQGGLLALLSAEGERRGVRLSPGEITQLLIASVTPIRDATLPWPGRPDADWSIFYGYGRPNALRALQLVDDGRIPPVADIDAPGWYERVDPVAHRRDVLAIRGTVSATRARSARYRVEYALGPEPADRDFRPLASGRVRGRRTGVLGRLPLSRIPASFVERAYRNSGDRTQRSGDPYEPYAVTLRLTVTDDRGLRGVDRQVFYAQHDPDRLPGFPIHLRASGEAQPVIADLNGDGRNEIVIPTSDGIVHAYEADGRELPGWPVRTDPSAEIARYRKVALVRKLGVPRDPIIASVAIGDLDADGRLDVVASTTGARVYAWNADGRRRRGFPVAVQRSKPYPVPSPAIEGHWPVAGAGSHPVLADLDGDGRPEILQTTAEKLVWALRADGSTLPGWPVELRYPAKPGLLQQFDGPVIVGSPAVGDIDGDGKPEVVIGSQDTLINPAGKGPGFRPLYAIRATGTRASDGPFLPGWPVMLPDAIAGVVAGIDFISGVTASPILLDVDGDGRNDVVASTSFGTPLAFDGAGHTLRAYAGVGTSGRGPEPLLTFTSGATPARVGERLQVVAPGSAILSLVLGLPGVTVPGTTVDPSTPIYNYTRAWDAATGLQTAGFPRIQQGLGFFAAPAIADIDGDGKPEALLTTDSFVLHAFHLDRPGEAAGYPKFTGGWGVYTPGVGDVDGDGKPDVVMATREGYLDAFRGHGTPDAVQWCAFQGSATHEGRYTGHCPTPASRRTATP